MVMLKHTFTIRYTTKQIEVTMTLNHLGITCHDKSIFSSHWTFSPLQRNFSHFLACGFNIAVNVSRDRDGRNGENLTTFQNKTSFRLRLSLKQNLFFLCGRYQRTHGPVPVHGPGVGDRCNRTPICGSAQRSTKVNKMMLRASANTGLDG